MEDSFGPLFSHKDLVLEACTSTITATGHERKVYNLCSGKHISLGYEVVEPYASVPLHTHEASEEVIHIISGAGEATIGDETFQLVAGSTLLIPIGTPHSFRSTSPDPLTLTFTFSPPVKLQL